MFISCDHKQSALNNLQSFTEQLEHNSEQYTAVQWDEAIATYNEICKNIDLYESEYNNAEQEQIGRLKGKCQTIFVRHAINDGIEGFIRTLWQYKGLFEGFLDNMNELINEF